jgi:Arc/MetJ-type ribon-helix-helix transcriptional regulator
MSKGKQPKLGKSLSDIFSKTEKEPPKEKHVDPIDPAPAENSGEIAKVSRGRPVEHKEGWSKVTVVLLDKQIHWLDQLASTIRLNTKAALSRAELIRAAISAIEESEMDLTDISSEQDIKNALLEKLKK